MTRWEQLRGMTISELTDLVLELETEIERLKQTEQLYKAASDQCGMLYNDNQRLHAVIKGLKALIVSDVKVSGENERHT
jgi:hypothetical protein